MECGLALSALLSTTIFVTILTTVMTNIVVDKIADNVKPKPICFLPQYQRQRKFLQ